MKLYWRRISISKGVRKEALKKAQEAASKHPKGELLSLSFTESNPEWVLLYDHAQLGQIKPEVMRYMKRADLYFLAGMTFPHPALTRPKDSNEEKFSWTGTAEKRWERATKLQGNAARAMIELERRNFVWKSVFIITAALIGALIGGAIGTH